MKHNLDSYFPIRSRGYAVSGVMVRLSRLLIAVFVVSVVIVRGAAGYGEAPSNPFLAYADVFNGRRSPSAVSERVTCFLDADEAPAESCMIVPQTGVFTHVDVRISQDRVQRTIFYPREGTLTYGDMMPFFGIPHATPNQHERFFFWHKSVVVVTLETTAYPMLIHPVSQIVFVDVDLSVKWIRHAADY